MSSADRPSHDRRQRAFALLCTVLPVDSEAFRTANEHSASAFEMLDRWLDYECVDVLRMGVPAEYASRAPRRLDEFILAPFLTAPIPGQQTTGIPIVKAILLLGVAEGRAEGQLITTLSAGAHKARRIGSWRQVMPRPLGPEAGISEALAHCQAHVESRLAIPGERAKLETEWLKALKRWCELLQKDRRAPPRQARAPSTWRQISVDGDEEAHLLPELFIDIEGSDNAPALQVDDATEIEPLLDVQAPEVRSRELRALPEIEDDPESLEGGEARRARTGYRNALENQFLPWANRQLNPADLATLVAAMKVALAAGQEARDTVGVLAWAHVTGQSIDQAVEIGRTPLAEGSYLDGRTYMRYVSPQDGAWEPTPAQVAVMRAHATHVSLTLPDEVADWLDERLQTEYPGSLRQSLGFKPMHAQAVARKWLSELRQATAGQQTLGRVTWWLPVALYQTRADHVPPHLLCAINDGLPCPSAYYRAYEIHDLGDLHQKTLLSAGWSFSMGKSVADDASRRWVGSKLNPNTEHVKRLWDRLTSHFEAVVGDASLPLFERHNAREIHEAFSQMFQTFHRAVNDPMESLSYIDMTLKRLLLDDKNQGEARAHRLIPLTSLAARQCEEQVEHVRRLSVAIAPVAPETAQRLVAMIEHPEWRVAPFRFLLNERVGIVRLTPKALLLELEGRWDLPLNLARHFGSTWLLENKDSAGSSASDESLCSLLGHHDLGTQNLSLLSPRDFNTLYGALTPRLEAFVDAIGLRSIPSFLPERVAEAALTRSRKRPSEMMFGHRRREQVRARQHASLQAEAGQWVREQLGTRNVEKLMQEDVDALFERVRKATPNRRNYWASERFEAMRAVIVDVIGRFENIKLELPAIALAVRDVAHICTIDGIEAAKWLDRMRQALAAARVESFRNWRSERTTSFVTAPEMAVLSLVVDALVIDPAVWAAWGGGNRHLDVSIDTLDHAWIRMPLPTRNTRLYPLRRDLAERLAGIPNDAWLSFKFEAVVGLARSLMAPWHGANDTPDFWQLLNWVQTGSAARMPGIALGYADGSHGSVSPQRMCIERQGGLPPTKAAVAAWDAARSSLADLEEALVTSEAKFSSGNGSLTQVAEFRRLMSQALQKMDRTPTLRRGKPRRHKSHGSEKSSPEAQLEKGAQHTAEVSIDNPSGGDGDRPADQRRVGRGPGPLARFVDALGEHWADLVDSPRLPPACGLSVRWVHRMAEHGQAGGTDYAPKTIRNYWYSWVLRFIEEFGSIDPRNVSPSECEEIYLQIVENAAVLNRQHLYAPMRSFHRYLSRHHGVAEIDWEHLRSATGQGLTYVDANLVHEHEYLMAFDLLRNDKGVSERVRTLQAAALVLLYRFGLRIAECLGLRINDIIFDIENKHWMVRVRGNQHRSLKTGNARRSVIALETLTNVEDQVLKGWAAHVETFATGTDIRPLFAATTTGNQAGQLFPRRIVALRIGQALRLATGDPSIRVHHCRHSYATRMLLVGLGYFARAEVDQKQKLVQSELMQRVREMLTGETEATRRLLWAIAVQLGHGSPLTTLETYTHGGHLILRQWCVDVLWAPPADVDMIEWMAWSTGTTLKTMQRDFQRHELKKVEERIERVLGQWSRVFRLGEGSRVHLSPSLPTLRLVEGPQTLVSVDLIIDHARRFGRVDGLAERLFVSELWVELVLLAARNFASRHRTSFTLEGQWWIESCEVEYQAHESDDIAAALEALQMLEPAALRFHCQGVEPYLVPSSRMVVVESMQTLVSAATLAKELVDDPNVIQLLVPAKLPKRLNQAERERRDNSGRRKAELMNIQFKQGRPRLLHEQAVEFDGSEQLIDHAKNIGLSVASHGRIAGARNAPHDRRRAGARLALRIKENGYDNVRSAKVFARILASAIVSCRAEALALEVGA